MKKRTIVASFLLVGAAYALIARIERNFDDGFAEAASFDPSRFGGAAFFEADDRNRADGAASAAAGSFDAGFSTAGSFNSPGSESAAADETSAADDEGVVSRVEDFDPFYWTEERMKNATPM